MSDNKVKVTAQKADPAAAIRKTMRGGFETTIICVMENGEERKHTIRTSLKRDLVKKLEKLPIENVKGMELGNGSWTIELFGYNGV